MKAPDLIEGKRYIIKRGTERPVAIYEGKHGGKLTLADGSVYFGGDNLLRFTHTRSDGSKQTLLLASGADVDEPEDTKLAREQFEAERAARFEASLAEAVAFLTRLGLEVVEKPWDARQPGRVAVRGHEANVDEFEVQEMTIGKLKLAIERGQPIAAR